MAFLDSVISEKERELNLIKEFAKLNNWYFTRSHFNIEMLARRNGWKPFLEYSPSYRYNKRMEFSHNISQSKIWDHPLWFRKDHQYPAAIALQPYNHISLDLISEYKLKLNTADLDIYIPPNQMESFWSPNHCWMLLVAPTNINVKWLSNQQ